MVIKLPFTATLKGHVQTLNPLLDKGFRKIRAGRFKIHCARSNDAPRFGGIYRFLTMCQKQKTLQINIYRVFKAF
ncbi:MAG: hypothetical protein BGO52_11515 [Sphingobacteriales bacterium 44-61]|nr:MAG: hypothetical protein BGO52_11515 [Sphingobacteriales bacterium 44-61]